MNGVSNSKAAIRNDRLMRLYDADSELKAISCELDSFDGKNDPIRCNLLVNQLRTAQDKVISLLFQLMDDCNCERASRDYRMKFPDEILLSEGSESLNGQIWFGAECLSAGSNILNHTRESTMLRPMAKTLTQHLDSLRNDLRDLVVDGGGAARINHTLIKKMVAFDHIFATFEYEYVRTMLPIRTVAEIEKLQEVAVLFSETLIDCVKRGLIKQDDIDEFQPIVMIAIPRLAIVRGLLYKNENPIYSRHKSHMCSLFQPFHGPLHSIRKLLRSLSLQDSFTLERMLANDQSIDDDPISDPKATLIQAKAKSQEGAAGNAPDGDSTTILAQQRDDYSPRDCDQSGQASTSNNYTNVLMDGLQYPVGRKRNSTDVDVAAMIPDEKELTSTNKDNDDDSQQYNCNFEVQASSSKAILDEQQHGHVDRSASLSPVRDKAKGGDEESKLEDLFQMHTQQLLHRLFVAISGVADQLQSNFASDLRFILKHIFSSEICSDDEQEENDNQSDDNQVEDEDDDEEYSNPDNSDSSLPVEQGIEAREVNLIDFDSSCTVMDTNIPTDSRAEITTLRQRDHHHHRHHHHAENNGAPSRQSRRSRGPPVWVPDQLVVQCSYCSAPFTLFRRRHHCRACGQIFCADCSRYTRELSGWGYKGQVRVCESCFFGVP